MNEFGLQRDQFHNPLNSEVGGGGGSFASDVLHYRQPT